MCCRAWIFRVWSSTLHFGPILGARRPTYGKCVEKKAGKGPPFAHFSTLGFAVFGETHFVAISQGAFFGPRFWATFGPILGPDPFLGLANVGFLGSMLDFSRPPARPISSSQVA
jgi:hypothetical protein